MYSLFQISNTTTISIWELLAKACPNNLFQKFGVNRTFFLTVVSESGLYLSPISCLGPHKYVKILPVFKLLKCSWHRAVALPFFCHRAHNVCPSVLWMHPQHISLGCQNPRWSWMAAPRRLYPNTLIQENSQGRNLAWIDPLGFTIQDHLRGLHLRQSFCIPTITPLLLERRCEDLCRAHC